MDKNEYTAFYQEFQTLLNSRPVSGDELNKYVQFIESVGMEKDAFLMIVQYCVGLKGGAVPSPYITKFAKCFADDGNLTVEQIQKAFSKKSNGDDSQQKDATSQEEYLIRLFRKLNPRLKKNVVDIVKGLTTSLDNK